LTGDWPLVRSAVDALAVLEAAVRYEHAVAGLPFNAHYGSLYSAYVRSKAYLVLGRPADAAPFSEPLSQPY
jgi:hypothetical protein